MNEEGSGPSFRTKFREAAGSNTALESLLGEALGLGPKIRVYETTTELSRQLKNKLSQARSRATGGMLVLRLPDQGAVADGRAALEHRWAEKDDWIKDIPCVVLGYPLGDEFEPRVAIEWTPLAATSLLKERFPSMEIVAAKRSVSVGTSATSSDSSRPRVLPAGSPSVWIEVTSMGHSHGGEAGWRLGEALWSPVRNKAGHDRYELMTELAPGDIVLHLADEETGQPKGILGWSTVAARSEVSVQGPAEPGAWAGQEPFYRVPLRDHHRLPSIVPIDRLFTHWREVVATDAAQPSSPFARHGETFRLAMGKYISRCSPAVFMAIDQILRFTRKVWGIYVGSGAAQNFSLARRESTWGADDPKKFVDIREGDGLLFVHEIASDRNPVPAGFPRVKAVEEFSGTVSDVVYGVVSSAPYTSSVPLWPNGLYPARFAFKELKAEEQVSFSAQTFPRDLVDAVRVSAISTGRPKEAFVYDLSPWTPEVGEVVAKEDPSSIVAEFSAALLAANVSFGAEHEEVVRLFLASLMAKPFVILTGLSGSGKTQIALKLGEWFGEGRCRLIPVRPDWTGPEFLLGYEDGLRKPSEDGRRAWTVPAALEFMLSAASDPHNPYLLILDEMNLAHVERYFADILSGMESRAEVLPDLQTMGGSWYQQHRGARIPIPRNLFIVGTVNVDETTYLFSPKVLDRANTLEFRVTTAALPDDPSASKRPTTCQPGTPELVAGMQSIAAKDTWHHDNAAPTASEVVKLLRALHEELSLHGHEFGHRTFYEGLRLTSLLHAAGARALEQQVDAFILQKLLPRVHGARRTLEPVLRALGEFAIDLSVSKSGGISRLDSALESPARLPRTFKKILRMMKALRTNQFASFSD